MSILDRVLAGSGGEDNPTPRRKLEEEIDGDWEVPSEYEGMKVGDLVYTEILSGEYAEVKITQFTNLLGTIFAIVKTIRCIKPEYNNKRLGAIRADELNPGQTQWLPKDPVKYRGSNGTTALCYLVRKVPGNANTWKARIDVSDVFGMNAGQYTFFSETSPDITNLNVN